MEDSAMAKVMKTKSGDLAPLPMGKLDKLMVTTGIMMLVVIVLNWLLADWLLSLASKVEAKEAREWLEWAVKKVFFVNFLGWGWQALLFLISLALIFAQPIIVEEAKAVAVMRFGGYSRMLMAWKGHRLAPNGDVIAESDFWTPLIGGFRIIVRFVENLHRYKFRWSDVHDTSKGREVRFHGGEDGEGEILDYISLRPDVYYVEIVGAETKAVAVAGGTSERIQLKVGWLLNLQVDNPRKALFDSPSQWLDDGVSLFSDLGTGWVNEHTYDQVLEARRNRDAIWRDLGGDPLFTNIFRGWGFFVHERGIGILSVDAPPDIEEAGRAQRKQQLIAQGFAQETTGRLVAMAAELMGIRPDQVQQMFRSANPAAIALVSRHKDMLLDLVQRRLGLGSGQTEILTKTPEGLFATLANIFHGGLESGGDKGTRGTTTPPSLPNPGGPSGSKGSNKKGESYEEWLARTRKEWGD